MKKLTKARQIFLYLAPFPALAFFKIWAASGPEPGTLTIIALSMLAYCAIVIGIAYRWDKPAYFDWAVTAYFAIISFFFIFWPEFSSQFFAKYAVTGIYACLFSAAFFPPLLGMDPFTYHYAKKYTPEDAWENPIFVKINIIMTYVWAGLFAVCLLSSLYPSVFTRALIPLALILGVGLPFNFRFPDFYLRRLGLPTLAEQRHMAEEATQEESAPSPVQLPKSAWEAISHMPDVFNAEAAGTLSAIIGFIVSGSEAFEVYVEIRDGACTMEDQPSRKPDLIIRTPAHVWLAISRGELGGQKAFMSQAFTAEGNLGLLIRMGKIFSASSSSSKKDETLTEKDHSVASEETTEIKNEPLVSDSRKKENTMKVLALNSSPRTGGESKTELMLNALVEGIREAGAELEVVNLRKKTVKNCIGCFTCWTKTPGVCIHKDDMTNELYPKWLESDLVVYATPLYYFGVNATMKTFIERTLPILQPFFEKREGRTAHPLRDKYPAIVMLSVAGFPEDSVFDQLSSWTNFVFREVLAAEIYRPVAEILTVPVFAKKAKEILDATTQAGREIVETMKVSPETLASIKQPILEDNSIFHKMGNLMWKTCIAEGVTPKEFREKGLIPRPDSIETFTMIMPMGFNPEAAGDTKAVLQFNFSGDTGGSCHFKIENGEIDAIMGASEKPDLTIDAPFDVWMDIMTGKADGQQMFMEQKYKVVGDLSLLMRINELFGK
ncbi:MAG: SCP2 sterol-binding domain-containing protein [Desulfobacteraceae bacterium]